MGEIQSYSDAYEADNNEKEEATCAWQSGADSTLGISFEKGSWLSVCATSSMMHEMFLIDF